MGSGGEWMQDRFGQASQTAYQKSCPAENKSGAEEGGLDPGNGQGIREVIPRQFPGAEALDWRKNGR